MKKEAFVQNITSAPYSSASRISTLIRQIEEEAKASLPIAVDQYTILNDINFRSNFIEYRYIVNTEGMKLMASDNFNIFAMCHDIRMETLNREGYKISA